jgi:hypothetical protein
MKAMKQNTKDRAERDAVAGMVPTTVRMSAVLLSDIEKHSDMMGMSANALMVSILQDVIEKMNGLVKRKDLRDRAFPEPKPISFLRIWLKTETLMSEVPSIPEPEL